PLALVFISAYSYAKRFTHWSHLWLGLADGIATPAGYLAVTGRWSEPWWLLPVGALAVTFWVGGFDVFYALQDEAFDRSERLESLVVRLGRTRAILVAKLLHGLALVALVLFGVGAGLGVAYYVGVAAGAAPIARPSTARSRPAPPRAVTRLTVSIAITGGSGATAGVRLLTMLAVHRVPRWRLVSGHGWRLPAEE